MIKEIILKNFKAFSDLKKLEIKPLTILCGVNSAGKSSIIKSLLLLKQSHESVSANNSLTLNGLYTMNGSMEDVLTNGKGDSFFIENTFSIKNYSRRFAAHAKQDIVTAKELSKITGLNPDVVNSFDITVKYCVKKDTTSYIIDMNCIDKCEIVVHPIFKDEKNALKYKQFSVKMQRCNTNQYNIRRKGSSNIRYNIQLENFPAISGNQVTIELKKCVCYFNGIRLTNLYLNNPPKEIELNKFLTNIYAVFKIVSDQYAGVKYLGPLRERPKRQYSAYEDFLDFNCTGADTPFVLDRKREKHVDREIFPPMNEDCFERKVELSSILERAVQAWMGYFELGKLSISVEEETFKIKIGNAQHRDGEKESNIVDVGFGVSQILPIIVYGLALDYEQTFILEQPEIHLHPRMQMRMADFMLSLSQTNHSVIVETHSDHVINRIVRRALECKDDTIIDNIAIYFVENTGSGSEISKISIDRIAGIIDCPKDFFSQFASETNYILQAGLKNIKQE